MLCLEIFQFYNHAYNAGPDTFKHFAKPVNDVNSLHKKIS